MKKLVAVILLTVMAAGITGAAEQKIFQIDPVHSSVQFRIRHLYSIFSGRFNKFEGTISGDPAAPASLRVTASVDVTSIDTANADREKHLRTPDFFDTEHHPIATFISTKVTVGELKDSGMVTGKMTIHGVTKDVTFSGQFLGHGTDPRGASRAGFHATTTINRADFGLAYNSTMTNGVTVLGTDVELILDLEAIEVNAAVASGSKQPAASTKKQIPDKATDEAIRKAEKELQIAGGNDGLKTGDKAPDFSLPDMAGKTVSLYASLKKGPVVLVFYRGEWCPFCNMQLRSLEKAYPDIQTLGASLIAISPQTGDKSAAQSGDNNLSFPLLTDDTGATMKAYHLLFDVPEAMQKLYREKLGVNLEDYNGKGRWQLPVTSTYIIDQKAVIRDGLVDFDYTKRMEPADIIKALKTLRQN
ncbi:MAG: YceI family protein [bacterium]